MDDKQIIKLLFMRAEKAKPNNELNEKERVPKRSFQNHTINPNTMHNGKVKGLLLTWF